IGECAPVHRLMALDAGRRVRPRGRAFEMNDASEGLVEDFASRCTNGKGKIDVLVIRGRIALVESSKRSEQGSRNREAGARAVVDFAQIVVFGSLRIVVASVVPRRSVAPRDGSSFL